MSKPSINLAMCAACKHGQSACHGPCACTLDGRQMWDHAKAGDCPIGLHRKPDLDDPDVAAARLELVNGGCCGAPSTGD